MIGLIAGSGSLPGIFKKEAERRGEKVFSVGIKGITSIHTEERLAFGRVGELISLFKERGIKKIVMLGKFEHRLIYNDFVNIDEDVRSVIAGSSTRKPADIIRSFMLYMEKRGFIFINPKPFLSSILSDKGPMNGIAPRESAMADAVLGFPIAKAMANFDVGQTIVLKDKAVVAVEAMEGTQKTIERAGRIAGKGCRVLKVGRDNQDFRVDVPTVGVDTIKVMIDAGADVLFLEAGSVYMVDKEKMLDLAERHRISVYGIDPDVIK